VPAPNRLENLRSLRFANVDVAFATAFATLITGIFLVGFIKSLGGSDYWIGLLSAVPSLIGILQIPGAIWGRSFASYKRFVMPGGLIWRLGYVPLVVLPFLPIADGAKLVLLMTCVIAASVANVIVSPIYNDWIAEMVPPDSRGVFFARRNAIATAVGAGVGLIGALVLDSFRARDQERLGFTLVFALALACATLSMLIFLRMQDLRRETPVRQNLVEGIRAVGHPFRDVDFRRVLVFLAFSVFGQMFAGNLFAAYGLETLKLDFKILQATAITYAIGNVLTARFWGFLSDKYGNRPVLVMVGFLVSLNPIPWIVCQPGQTTMNAAILLIGHVFMGAVWGGVQLCQFNIILATAKPADRANYIGAGMTITSIIGGLSPLLGATLMSQLRGPFDAETAYKIVFGAAVAFRFISVFFLVPVREKGSRHIRAAIDDLRRVTPRGVRAMRSLARSEDVASREEAIQSVGTEGVRLASDEVIRALHDPQPRVRRQAAATIARLQDPRAVGELIHQVEEHPDLLEEEMIEALGAIGDVKAMPALIRTLQSPRSILRRAAARALGKLGANEPAAVEALIQAAGDATDVDLRRSALQALRVLGAMEAADVIRRGIRDPHPSVRIAAAEAVAEMGVAEAAPELRESMRQYDDEASSEIAYALGCVGTTEDIPLILQEAQASRSMITRRRCLLGVARLLGVEQATYRLFLRKGMERDSALFALLTPLSRRRPRVRAALDRYSSGDEPGALEALARSRGRSELQALAATPVEEAFLVAAVVAAADSEA